MNGYQRILVGTDLSEQAAAAAHVALRIGDGTTRYRIVHVAPTSEMPERTEHDAGMIRARLADWSAHAGVATREQVVLFGSAAHELQREAASFRADLTVVGHVGRSRIDRLLLGSTARSILRLTACDTLVVRSRPPDQGPPFPDMLVATDFYAPSARAAARAVALADQLHGGLSVVHAIAPDMWREAVHKTPRDEFPDAEGWLRGTYADMLSKFNKEHLGGRAKEHLTRGSPAKAIADQARLQGADLVVVGTHGAHGVERLLLGAHAEAIIEQASCSVLVVR